MTKWNTYGQKLGYPPLVTPFSQYVKNVALMNLMQQVKGEERWTMIDNHTWDMIWARADACPGRWLLRL